MPPARHKKRFKILLFGELGGRHHNALNGFLGPYTSAGYTFSIDVAFSSRGHFLPTVIAQDEYDIIFVPVSQKLSMFWAPFWAAVKNKGKSVVIVGQNGARQIKLPSELTGKTKVNESMTEVDLLTFAKAVGLPLDLI
ncbi:hypothetical protein COT97_05825 [Candidatus Falkowbacteria bacterium CG10_big_fil_rev_8_21_14_0_10_39_11]|uniref:Uncharacterized protein n=1 Tax=Candidatus Falkowbacteria bacterium CG10_big_fil_rev_8_21_14_0_10_39_11 TaxID=1974565 RepID=A0A2H0V3A5_9BACT|nr:MAG: hypothetical protein COT97_05825 [Candidatus Falkowbacteria bacterium CG10_big_fil_rev_8_21_14_0_10_39_11]